MISLAHKTLFVHIPKCGGQSIEETFLKDFGLNWKNHRKLLLCMPKPVDWYGKSSALAHLAAQEYLDGHYLNQTAFESLYKFAVVRNPFKKMESHFTYGEYDQKYSFENFIVEVLPNLFKNNPFFRTQSEFIFGSAGKPLIDNIYKLENLSAHWPEIQEKSGLVSALTHKNSTTKLITPLKWNPKMIEGLLSLYAKDFENFGYEVSA